MKKNLSISRGFILLLLVLPVLRISAQEAVIAPPGRIIVKFNGAIVPEISRNSDGVVLFKIPEVDKLNIRYGCMEIRKLLQGRKDSAPSKVYLLKFSGNPDIFSMMKEYLGTGYFDYVEPDYIGKAFGDPPLYVPNDPYFYRQWSLNNDGTFIHMAAKIGADIDMMAAWDIETGDSNTIAGIIDTGCKLDHPEFAGRIWTNAGEIPGNNIDDDNNGFVDDVHGWNFAYNNNNPSDDGGHGTAVATIIGATGDNDMGYAGINWRCKLMISKSFDSTSYGYWSDCADAIIYSVDNGATVLNMSFGGTSGGQVLEDAINYALSHNVTCVVAMGNNNNSTPFYPAAYPGVIAVGSTNSDDARSVPFCFGAEPGSSYGSHISVVAPGNLIFVLSHLHDYEYFWAWCGTSFATPHVAGTVSLLQAKNPSLTPAQIKSVIENSAEDLVGNPYEDTPGWDPYYGHGRLNAYQALTGINDVQRITVNQNDRVKIYPNPTTGLFNLMTATLPSGTKPEIIITDLLGVEQYRGFITSSDTRIDFSRKNKGIYIVCINTGRERMTGKVVVQ